MAAIKVLLVRGGGYHPFEAGAAILRQTFENAGMARCTLADRDTAFDGDLSGYDVVVLYAQGGKLTSKQEKNLCGFVRGGGGLVGFHCASDSYVENAEFMKMIGTHFVSHAPGTPPFEVEIANAEHPLADGLEPFTIVDEFYLLERKSDDLDVFLTAQWQGKPQPMAYTKSYGDGRVFYSANGHDERAFRNPGLQRLAVRALLWAAGRFKPIEEPIGVGLLGYGATFNMGKLHADLLTQAGGFEITAVCDLLPERRQKAEEELPGVVTYPNVHEMLKDNSVEMVVCILPHDVHAENVVHALRAGRHVVCEKPFCLSEKQAASMLDAARKSKVTLTVFQNRRWDHHYMAAKRIVESGMIGEVFETHLDFASYSHPGTWWRSDKKISGGVLFDWGAHVLDWMLHLIPHKVVGVSAYYQKRKWMMVTNEDHVRVVLRFANGAVANFANSSLYGCEPPGWRILGTEGGIHLPTIFDAEATVRTFAHGEPRVTKVPTGQDTWPSFYKLLRDHLHYGAPVPVRPESSARVIHIMDTAEKSAKVGRELPFADKYFGK